MGMLSYKHFLWLNTFSIPQTANTIFQYYQVISFQNVRSVVKVTKLIQLSDKTYPPTLGYKKLNAYFSLTYAGLDWV